MGELIYRNSSFEYKYIHLCVYAHVYVCKYLNNNCPWIFFKESKIQNNNGELIRLEGKKERQIGRQT